MSFENGMFAHETTDMSLQIESLSVVWLRYRAAIAWLPAKTAGQRVTVEIDAVTTARFWVAASLQRCPASRWSPPADRQTYIIIISTSASLSVALPFYRFNQSITTKDVFGGWEKAGGHAPQWPYTHRRETFFWMLYRWFTTVYTSYWFV